jgi:predicted permease
VSLQDVALGIEPEGVLVYDVHLPAARYPDAPKRLAFYDAFYERVQALPGVRAAGAVHWLPVQGRGYNWGLWRADEPPGTEPISAGVRVVERGYFGALGINFLGGRAFTRQDGPDAPLVTVLSRRSVERLFPGEDPLGQRVQVGGRTLTVIGMVEDVANDPLGDVMATLYFPHAQFADRHWALHQVVATSGDPLSLVSPLRDVLTSIDPELVLHEPRAMDDLLAAGLARQRLAASVMAAFAALALALAVVGIHGVLAFLVGRRTREIGIRVALGARAGSVRAMIVRESLAVALLGVAAGLAGALALSRWLRALVFEVEVTDPRVYGAVAAVMLAVALLASWMPARRAAAVDPVRAFRAE